MMTVWQSLTQRRRLLSDAPITDLKSLAAAIQVLHKTYQVPHVIITSLRLTRDNQTISSKNPSRAPSKTHTPSASPKRNAETSHPSAWPTSDSAASQSQLQPP